MHHSETVAKLAEALGKAQGGFTHVGKDGTSHHGRYATLASVLETVRPGLAEHGLSIVQAPASEGSTVTVTTRIMHSSGEWLETTISAPAQTDIQKLGSSISYLRRYSLMAVLSLAADDDDDGNVAKTSKPTQNTQRQAPRPVAQVAPKPSPTDPIGEELGGRLEAQLKELLKGTRHEGMTYPAFASTITGRKIQHLRELTRDESKAVYVSAKSEQEDGKAA